MRTRSINRNDNIILLNVECFDCGALQGDYCDGVLTGLFHESRHTYSEMSDDDKKAHRKKMLRMQKGKAAKKQRDFMKDLQTKALDEFDVELSKVASKSFNRFADASIKQPAHP